MSDFANIEEGEPITGAEALEFARGSELEVELIPWLEAMRRRTQQNMLAGMPAETEVGGYALLAGGPPGFTETEHPSSGGTSSVVQSANGEELLTEVQLEYYAVLWSTELSADSVMRSLSSQLPDAPQELVVLGGGGSLEADDVESALRVIDLEPERVAFFRAQYPDRVLTWEERRAASAEGRVFVPARVGLVAEQIDERYLATLMALTASFSLLGAAATLARHAAEVLRSASRFREESLDRGGGSTGIETAVE